MRWLSLDKLQRGTLIAVGVLMGAGGYTFLYARGYSYMSNNPEVCVNCHIMRDQFNSWQHSSHSTVECNGCHVPHNFVGKWLTKGENGFRHSWAFTFGPPEVIRARAGQRRVLQKNCLHCHGEMVSHITTAQGRQDRPCFECHRGVAHPF